MFSPTTGTSHQVGTRAAALLASTVLSLALGLATSGIVTAQSEVESIAAASPPAVSKTVEPSVPTPTAIELPVIERATTAVRVWREGHLVALDVPIRSQFDGSEFQSSNCGPAALAMVLDAFGVEIPTPKLRNLANVLQGTFDAENGIALDFLGVIAQEAGLRTLGLKEQSRYKMWTVDDVRSEIRYGHPVITLVRMRELPDHAPVRTADDVTDHYVVVVGLFGDDFLINDPAIPGVMGQHRVISGEQLERAWEASSVPRQAMAVAAGDGIAELNFAELSTRYPPTAAFAAQETQVTPTTSPLPATAVSSTTSRSKATPVVPVSPDRAPLADGRQVTTTSPLVAESIRQSRIPAPQIGLEFGQLSASATAGTTNVKTVASETPSHWLVRGALLLVGAFALRWVLR